MLAEYLRLAAAQQLPIFARVSDALGQVNSREQLSATNMIVLSCGTQQTLTVSIPRGALVDLWCHT